MSCEKHSKNGKILECNRKLNEFPVLIRNNEAVHIIRKVLALHEKTLDTQVSSSKPFGLESNTPFEVAGDIILKSSNGIGKISKSHIP